MKVGKKRAPVAEARADTPVDELGEKETLMHYNAVLLEDLKSKMELIIEWMQAIELRFNVTFEAIDKRFDAIDARFLTLEAAVRGLKGDIMILDAKFDRLVPRVDNHEHRISALEQA